MVVICKECTKRLDDKGVGRIMWHNLWELIWVKERYFGLMDRALEDLKHNSEHRWSIDAVQDLNNLGEIVHQQEDSEPRD